MAQLKRDHPELALTATDEAQLQSGQWQKAFKGSVKGLVHESYFTYASEHIPTPRISYFQISESIPGFRNGKMILEWGSSPKLVL